MSKPLIFEPIFGRPAKDWPTVMQKHYAVRPDSGDRVTVQGVLTIRRSGLMRALSPLLGLFGALLPCEGEDIPAIVTFHSGPGSNDFYMDRLVRPPGRRPLRFKSRLVPLGGQDVFEAMGFGLGWHAQYELDGNAVTLRQKGYAWRAGRLLIPLPLTWLIGTGAAREDALSETRFKMWMTITHRLFGETYRYEGTFEIVNVVSNDGTPDHRPGWTRGDV